MATRGAASRIQPLRQPPGEMPRQEPTTNLEDLSDTLPPLGPTTLS